MDTEYTDPTEIIPCPECGEPLTCITTPDGSRYSLLCSGREHWATPWFPTRREAREYALAEYTKRKAAAEEPEPTALQRAQEAAQRVANHWYTEDNLERMSAYAALASAEALTRIAEALETWLEAQS